MRKSAQFGSLAAIMLSLAACGGPAPNGPAYVAPTTEAHSPGVATQDGVTSPAQAFGSACSQLPQGGASGSAASMSSQPVATAASSNPMLSTFSQLVTKLGLTDKLNHNKEMTVFAPSNDAFNKLHQQMGDGPYNALLNNKTELTSILLYHTLVHRYDEAGLVNAGTVTALEGASLKVQGAGDALTLADNTKQVAHVVCGNLPTANATVFIVDTVLLPDYPGAQAAN